ncbi:MAG: permease [Bacillota bacterium]
MIEDWFSHLILIIETTYEIMEPLWLFLIIGSLLAILLERLNLIRFCPSNPAVGSLLGIISPIPTINMIKLVKPSKSASAILFSSLLANPTLLIIIYINLGLGSVVFYTLLIFIIGTLFGMFIPYNKETNSEKEESGPKGKILYRFWGHFSFIGFYTLVGAFIAALMRTFISYTMYNNDILGRFPTVVKTLFVLSGGPLYSCGGTWLPVLKELNELGLSLGAVLGFILFGQATRIGHLMALRSVFSKKHIWLFIIITGGLGLFLGYIF